MTIEFSEFKIFIGLKSHQWLTSSCLPVKICPTSPLSLHFSLHFSLHCKTQLKMWDIAMFANGTIGGSGYNFNITFFNESEINMIDDPCTSPYGHHLICMTEFENDSKKRIDNGIIVTDKWILTSATTCLNFYDNPWNNYFIHAGTHNLTHSDNGSIIKDYHIYSKENQNQEQGCNQNDDYCMIELETPLIISENIQAIGFQHFTATESAALELTTTVVTTSTPTTSTTITTTTTTSTTTSTRVTTTTRPFDKCWIAAWSENNLRTFKVDIDNYCYSYYSSDHISFRRHKSSSKKNMKEEIEANEKNGAKKPKEHINDVIMNPQGEDYYGRRSHICIDNLRHVCIRLILLRPNSL